MTRLLNPNAPWAGLHGVYARGVVNGTLVTVHPATTEEDVSAIGAAMLGVRVTPELQHHISLELHEDPPTCRVLVEQQVRKFVEESDHSEYIMPLVIEVGEPASPVGMMTIETMTDWPRTHSCEVAKMLLCDTARGQGIGITGLTLAGHIALNINCAEYFYWVTDEDNTASIKLIKSLGPAVRGPISHNEVRKVLASADSTGPTSRCVVYDVNKDPFNAVVHDGDFPIAFDTIRRYEDGRGAVVESRCQPSRWPFTVTDEPVRVPAPVHLEDELQVSSPEILSVRDLQLIVKELGKVLPVQYNFLQKVLGIDPDPRALEGLLRALDRDQTGITLIAQHHGRVVGLAHARMPLELSPLTKHVVQRDIRTNVQQPATIPFEHQRISTREALHLVGPLFFLDDKELFRDDEDSLAKRNPQMTGGLIAGMNLISGHTPEVFTARSRYDHRIITKYMLPTTPDPTYRWRSSGLEMDLMLTSRDHPNPKAIEKMILGEMVSCINEMGYDDLDTTHVPLIESPLGL